MTQTLWQTIFSTPEMDEVFEAENFFGYMLRFEQSLAQVQGDAGLIPAAAAAIIVNEAYKLDWDASHFISSTGIAGNPAIPFIGAFRHKVKERDQQAATFVHFGATSQDLIDTTLMLQLKFALDLLLRDAVRLQELLAGLARTHAGTYMTGRTLLQQARPVTFGFKAAGWLDGLNHSIDQLREIKEKTLTFQLGGACGTLPAFGTFTEDVLSAFGKKLGLNMPDIAWHTQRYRIAEIASALAILCGTLGKMGNDIILLMQTEVAEVSEGAAPNKGGSSAMPHKRNPVSSAFLVAIAGKAAHLPGSIFSGLVQAHERAAGAWHAEWDVLPELCKLASASLSHSIELISTLEVDTGQMIRNMELTRGLIYAEDINNFLALKADKNFSESFLKEACAEATPAGIHLREHLMHINLLTGEEAEQLFNPAHSIGQSGLFIERVLKQRI